MPEYWFTRNSQWRNAKGEMVRVKRFDPADPKVLGSEEFGFLIAEGAVREGPCLAKPQKPPEPKPPPKKGDK